MTVERVKQYLDEHDVHYTITPHEQAFTAQEVAAEAHVSGRRFAKVVVVKVDGQLALAVLPAKEEVQVDQLARSLGAESVALASEAEFRQQFPGCEVGAMPPFGNLFGVETYVSQHLAETEQIAFNAGTHTEVMELPYRDYERLAEPAMVAM
jgi:Ala-tRNA(Pro) deacylase